MSGRSARTAALAAVVLAAVGGGSFVAGRRWQGRAAVSSTAPTASDAQPASAPIPTFTQMTFRRGTLDGARFAQDGHAIVYSATWSGDADQLFLAIPGGDERPIGPAGAGLLAVSRQGELGLSLGRQYLDAFDSAGTLGRMPLLGEAPREVLAGVRAADFTADGQNLVAVRIEGGKATLTLLPDTVLYETPGWIGSPRVSPDGTQVAFIEHPWRDDDRGGVAIVDLQTDAVRVLADGWNSIQGLAFSPHGDEIWFSAALGDPARALYAVSPTGVVRLLMRVPGMMTLQDVAADGRVLFTREEDRTGLMAMAPGATVERELSFYDWSVSTDISADGKTMLFTEEGSPGGPTYSVYLRPTDGSTPAVRLGEGASGGISPDGTQVLVATLDPDGISVIPTGAGAPRQVTDGSLQSYISPVWFPDGQRIAYEASAPGHGVNVWVQDLAGGTPRPAAPENAFYGTDAHPVSPDGKWISALGEDGALNLYPIDGGPPQLVPGVLPGEAPLGWTPDGAHLYVFRNGSFPERVYRVDVHTGARELWRSLQPVDPAGLINLAQLIPTPDGKAYVYSYDRELGDLYVADGVR
jgi:Tol biopolymer transport system component